MFSEVQKSHKNYWNYFGSFDYVLAGKVSNEVVSLMVYHSTNFDFSNKPSAVPSLWDVMVTPLNSWDEVFTTKKKFIIGLCRHWFAILFRKKKIVNTSWSDKVEISNILKLSPINIITNIPHVYENRRRGALGVICANTTKSLLGGAVSPILGELGWKKIPSLYHSPKT